MNYIKIVSVVLFRGRPMEKIFFLLFFSIFQIFFSEYPFIRQNKHGWKKMVLEKFLFAWFLEWKISKSMESLKNDLKCSMALWLWLSPSGGSTYSNPNADKINLQTKLMLPEVYTRISPKCLGSPLMCRWWEESLHCLHWNLCMRRTK